MLERLGILILPLEGGSDRRYSLGLFLQGLVESAHHFLFLDEADTPVVQLVLEVLHFFEDGALQVSLDLVHLEPLFNVAGDGEHVVGLLRFEVLYHVLHF